MPFNNLLQNLPSLESIVDRDPLIVDAELSVVEAIAMMSQSRGSRCLLSDSGRPHASEISVVTSHSAVLVVEDERLVGIFTERDALLKIGEKAASVARQPISNYMTAPVQSLSSKATNAAAASSIAQTQERSR